jgi:hypothetical protein
MGFVFSWSSGRSSFNSVIHSHDDALHLQLVHDDIRERFLVRVAGL